MGNVVKSKALSLHSESNINKQWASSKHYLSINLIEELH